MKHSKLKLKIVELLKVGGLIGLVGLVGMKGLVRLVGVKKLEGTNNGKRFSRIVRGGRVGRTS